MPTSGIKIEDYFPPAQNFPTLGSLISVMLPNAIILAAVILLLFALGAGIAIIVSAGSGKSDQMEKAKNVLTGSLAGFAIIFLAYLIIQLVQFITGVPILNPQF